MLARRLHYKLPAIVSPIRDHGTHQKQFRRWQTTASTTAVEPPPPEGQLSSVATSQILRITRESSLRTPGITWSDEEPVRNIVGGRETRKMNLYQAVRDALR